MVDSCGIEVDLGGMAIPSNSDILLVNVSLGHDVVSFLHGVVEVLTSSGDEVDGGLVGTITDGIASGGVPVGSVELVVPGGGVGGGKQ